MSVPVLFSLSFAVLLQAQAPSPGWHKFGEHPPPPPPRMSAPVPAALNLAPGSWIVLRIDRPLSSDQNHAGDLFTGTLVQPVMADEAVTGKNPIGRA